MSNSTVLASIGVFLLAAFVQAGPIELQIDPTLSTAEVELCLTISTTVCDMDSSPVAGSLTVALDCPAAPSEIILHDFLFQLTEPVNLNLDFGIFGGLVAAGGDLTLMYGAVDPMPPSPVVDSAFVIPEVPVGATGQLNYMATGTVCSLLQLSGLPCDDLVDLSSVGFPPITLAGSVTTDGDDAFATVQTAIIAPINPLNPDLGTIAIDADVVAAGQVPPPCCPGDLTGDDRVDLSDYQRFADCLLGPQGPVTGPCICADLDADDDVDLADFAEFQNAFQG